MCPFKQSKSNVIFLLNFWYIMFIFWNILSCSVILFVSAASLISQTSLFSLDASLWLQHAHDYWCLILSALFELRMFNKDFESPSCHQTVSYDWRPCGAVHSGHILAFHMCYFLIVYVCKQAPDGYLTVFSASSNINVISYVKLNIWVNANSKTMNPYS